MLGEAGSFVRFEVFEHQANVPPRRRRGDPGNRSARRLGGAGVGPPLRASPGSTGQACVALRSERYHDFAKPAGREEVRVHQLAGSPGPDPRAPGRTSADRDRGFRAVRPPPTAADRESLTTGRSRVTSSTRQPLLRPRPAPATAANHDHAGPVALPRGRARPTRQEPDSPPPNAAPVLGRGPLAVRRFASEDPGRGRLSGEAGPGSRLAATVVEALDATLPSSLELGEVGADRRITRAAGRRATGQPAAATAPRLQGPRPDAGGSANCGGPSAREIAPPLSENDTTLLRRE